MPRVKLTKKTVDRLAAPDPSGKQTLYWDSELKGFAVLCSGTTNARTFIAQRDLPDGRTRRITVGAVAEIDLGTARSRAADILDNLRHGRDPTQRSAGDQTLGETLEAYLAARKTLRPATATSYRNWAKHLAPWINLPLRSITSEMVEARHRSIADEVTRGNGGTTAANAALRLLRVLWNYVAEQTPDMPANPVRRLQRQWYAEPRRETLVRADELPAFYDAVTKLQSEVARDYLLLLLFTGMRKTEAATLRWSDIDFTSRVIRVPAARTKAKRTLDLPMSDFVYDLLVARRALGRDKYVFPARGGRISGSMHPLEQVAEASGIKVTHHDLRRTFITVAESVDISVLALKALINHSLGRGVTEGYVQMTTERLREPAQRVCDRLKELCGVTPVTGDNVAKLKRVKA
jgi:integrase